jgi:hypothetical protein
MRRNRVLLLLAVGLAAFGFLIVRNQRPPPAPVRDERPPPVANAPARPLQSDAEGDYIPGYRFTVGRFRFTGFTLRPEALVTFAQSGGGTARPAGCIEVQITADRLHLRCDYPQVGTVTIDGRFLTRSATARLDIPVVSAVITVRTASGEILYSARDSFMWHPGE